MNPILEAPAVRRIVYPFSMEFYHRAGELGLLGEDVELLEGVLLRKSPKSPLHEAVCFRLYRLVDGALAEELSVRHKAPLTFVRSEPEPDLAVVCESENDFWKSHPPHG